MSFKQRRNIGECKLSERQWKLGKDIKDILRPFYFATVILSGSSYSTIGKTHRVLRNLNILLKKSSTDDSDEKQFMKKQLAIKFDLYLGSNCKDLSQKQQRIALVSIIISFSYACD